MSSYKRNIWTHSKWITELKSVKMSTANKDINQRCQNGITCIKIFRFGTRKNDMSLRNIEKVLKQHVDLKYCIISSKCPDIEKDSYTGQFISPSGISDLCGTVAGMVTPKGSMSTEGETLQVSDLPYRCSICLPLVMRQMSIL